MTILGDIFQAIKFGIEFFVDKVPKPIKVILFLVMLLFVFSIIPTMLHFMGIHCNTNGDVMTTGITNIYDNIVIWRSDRELINATEFVPESVGFIGINTFVCRTGYCNVSGDLYYPSDNICDNETIQWSFGSQRATFSRCTSCDGVVDNMFIESTFLGGDVGYKCFGDAYAIDDEDKNLWQSTFCRSESNCVPPPNYFFNSTVGLYQCLDLDVCGINATEPEFELDSKLKEADAQILYLSDTDGIDRAITFTCDKKNLIPQITFFKIPVFDYRIWLFLYIIGFMVWLLAFVRPH